MTSKEKKSLTYSLFRRKLSKDLLYFAILSRNFQPCLLLSSKPAYNFIPLLPYLFCLSIKILLLSIGGFCHFSHQIFILNIVFFRANFSGRILFQVGCFFEFFNEDALWASKYIPLNRILPRKNFFARCGTHLKNWKNIFPKLLQEKLLLVLETNKRNSHLADRTAQLIIC